MQQEHDNQGELCTNGCGFFGSPSNGGMCSVCWKNAMSKKNGHNNDRKQQSHGHTHTHSLPLPVPASMPVHVEVLPMEKKEKEGGKEEEENEKVQEEEEKIKVEKKEEEKEEQEAQKKEGLKEEEKGRLKEKAEEEGAKEKTNIKPIQKNRKRCLQCKKKVGLTGIECRCSYVFCGLHRYPNQHECTFDYKKEDRMQLAKRNPGGGQFNKIDKL